MQVRVLSTVQRKTPWLQQRNQGALAFYAFFASQCARSCGSFLAASAESICVVVKKSLAVHSATNFPVEGTATASGSCVGGPARRPGACGMRFSLVLRLWSRSTFGFPKALLQYWAWVL